MILIIADELLAAPDKRRKPPSIRARTGPGPPARGGWAGLQTSWRWRALTPFDKRIAGPLGMQDYVPEELKYAYEPYSRHPYYGFRLRVRDAAPFGLLFLRNGRWGEQQVVPAGGA